MSWWKRHADYPVQKPIQVAFAKSMEIPPAALAGRVRSVPVDVSITVQGDLVFNQTVDTSEVISKLNALESSMGALVDAVQAAINRDNASDAAKDALIASLQASNADLGGQLTTALANDAADAQTIADKQAEIDAAAAETQSAIDLLATVDPAPVAPPVDEPPA
jgi:hypothetical protein